MHPDIYHTGAVAESAPRQTAADALPALLTSSDPLERAVFDLAVPGGMIVVAEEDGVRPFL